MAAYFDGLTAARHEAALEFEADALALRGTDGALLARWPYASLRSAERIAAGRAGRLSSTTAPGARLALAPEDPSDRLAALAPQLARRGDGLSWRALAGGAALAAGALVGLYFGLPLAVGPIAKLIPLEWEAALGRRVAADAAPGGSCEAPEGRAALAKLTARLAAASGVAHPFKVSVARNPRVNAFAAPGGEIVLLAGLLKKAESPEEVAGVLAHEMGHVVERHPTAAAVRVLGLQAVLTGILGDGSVAAALASAGGLLATLSYSRADERTADRLAAEMLDRAGISRHGLGRFFARLSEERAFAVPAYISTHPAPEERRAAFEGGKALPPPLKPEEWRALQAICG